MGYFLQAVVSTEPVLRTVAGSVEGACVVPLGQHLSLLPMTDELFDAVTAAGGGELAGFWKVPAGFADTVATCSAGGPIAYVEADYFGGSGTQSAQVWAGGETVLGPLHSASEEPAPADGSPISQALRRLGAVKGEHFDEFDAIGLGRHRDTDDWLPSPS